MRLNELKSTAEAMADAMADDVEAKFGDRIGTISIYNIVEDSNHKRFSLQFIAYGYFWINIDYEEGMIGCIINYGDNFPVILPNTQEWYSKMDIDKFLEELRREIELRIPDKYLKAHGYM